MQRVSFRCWVGTLGVACPTRFSDTASSVVEAAAAHAIAAHGYADNRRLRERIRALLEVEEDDPVDPPATAETNASDRPGDGT